MKISNLSSQEKEETTKDEESWVAQRSSLLKASCGRKLYKLVEHVIAKGVTLWDICVLMLCVGQGPQLVIYWVWLWVAS